MHIEIFKTEIINLLQLEFTKHL